MRKGRSTGKPTKEEAERFDAMKEAGCVIAYKRGLGWTPCEIHHLTVGGKHGAKRRGHEFTVGINSWSHRGVTFNGLTGLECLDLFGPSYAHEPRAFRELYPDDELLALQKRLLGEE